MYICSFYKLNFLCLPFFISSVLLSSFLASPVNLFSGMTSLILNFWALRFKTSKVSKLVFSLAVLLFLFVFQMPYRVENM